MTVQFTIQPSVSCPICGKWFSYQRPFVCLLDHISRFHPAALCWLNLPGPTFDGFYRCACGASFDRGSMIRHLHGQRDLRRHFAEAALNSLETP